MGVGGARAPSVPGRTSWCSSAVSTWTTCWPPPPPARPTSPSSGWTPRASTCPPSTTCGAHGVRPVAVSPGAVPGGRPGPRGQDRRAGDRGRRRRPRRPGRRPCAGRRRRRHLRRGLHRRTTSTAAALPAEGRVVAVWGPAGAPGRTTVADRAGRRCWRPARPRCWSTPTPTAAAWPRCSACWTRCRACSPRPGWPRAGPWPRGSGVVQRALDERLDRRDRSAAPRPLDRGAARAPSRRCWRSPPDRGHVVVDTGFSLEEDPAADYGSRPGPQPAHRRGARSPPTRSSSSAPPTRSGCPGWPVGWSSCARPSVRCRSGWSSTGCGRRSAGPSATSRHGRRGSRDPVALHFLPDDRDAVDRALVTGRTLTETAPDSAVVRALGEVADAVVPPTGPSAPRRRRLRRRRAGAGRPR